PAPRQRPDTRAPADSAGSPGETEAPRRHGRRGPAKHYAVVGIGTSTGGPVALQRVLTVLPATFPAPIVLVQHMPASFTPAFAERLNKLCRIEVRQAEDGDVLRPGLALLAPGGKQMMVENRGGQPRIRILPGDERLNYKPCVDVTFGSLARSFPGKTLGVILTGMGSDGKEGCRMMKQSGSDIWSQDEKSSVIYGMPMAVAKAGLTDDVLSLDEIGPRLAEGVC
ncbi:MAG: chemotaxis protein CheB, partial [Marinobacter adhaerens]|uniref:chemotaxis protein CheB n=1 Tax=Marinobacter adhaerens TaxID=1033846 RepID=UPI003C6B5FDB